MTIISAHISDDLYKSLQKVTHGLEESSSKIIRKALSSYVKRKLIDVIDITTAERSIKKSRNKTVSFEEVQSICGLLEN
jgi:predicted transcriptional regulator